MQFSIRAQVYQNGVALVKADRERFYFLVGKYRVLAFKARVLQGGEFEFTGELLTVVGFVVVINPKTE